VFGWGVPTISVAELGERLKASPPPLLLDVREPGEFAGGHVPGALNVPLAGVGVYAEDLDPGQEVIVICRSGNRSATAARRLRAKGFQHVTSVRGGISAWKGELKT
jgi:rhodanese-related sulfurtransferase